MTLPPPSARGGVPYFEPVVGTVIGDCYEVRQTLGRGAMGLVVLARDQFLERDVAIKFIRFDQSKQRGMRHALASEAKLLARIRHENVVSVYAFGEHENNPYFVMEHVAGRDLAGVLSEGRLSLDDALGVLDGACRGVQAIHDAGALHGDIKPANVMLGDSSRVVVTDFGAARLLRSPAEAAAFGTPAYIAPELLGDPQREELRSRSDVYSLAVLAYEMLSGQQPFTDEDIAAVLTAHVTRLPDPISTVDSTVPKAFDSVLARGLEKDPAQRTESAGALREQLIEARDSIVNSGTGKRFVVADDDPVFRMLAQELLIRAYPGAEIDAVEDGEQALRAVAERATTLALVDLEMPGFRGVEVVERLRQAEDTRRIPVVVVTGEGGARDWQRIASLGAAGFLIKPVDHGALLALVRRLIGESD